MQAIAKAGIEFFATAMRYCEVEQYGAQYRLLRLGDCDFEFDVTDVLYRSGASKYLDVMEDALQEIFLGSTATDFRIVVHPHAVRTFPSILDEEDTVAENLAFESALLYQRTGTDLDRAIIPHEEHDAPMREESDPVLVADYSPGLQERIGSITAGIREASHQCVASGEAVLGLCRALSKRDSDSGVRLAVGRFDSYTEYILSENGEWIFSQVREEVDPEDVAYFALHVLNLAGVAPDVLRHVNVFGTRGDAAVHDWLTNAVGIQAVPLNPIGILDLDTDQFDDDFQFESFALCLGAVLR